MQVRHPSLHTRILGIDFPNPVGLAAGFDKDGKHYAAMSALGFGFIEVGTVTPEPQSGNDKPRLFRLPNDRAIVNRMGFNNDGVDALVERLKTFRPTNLVIGGNIGRNKVTPNDRANEDYITCFEKLFDHVDYFVVNVSSPNTEDLRQLQERAALTELLGSLQSLNEKQQQPKPILVKIAPDLSDEQLDDVVAVVQETRIAGVIATNTTLSRDNLVTDRAEIEDVGAGGLSGAPLRNRSTEVIQYLSKKSDGSFPIIAVGGICSPHDALQKLEAGASLVQIYTGLIYSGPGLIRQINQKIVQVRTN